MFENLLVLKILYNCIFDTLKIHAQIERKGTTNL